VIAPDCDYWAPLREVVDGYWRPMDGTIGPAASAEMAEAEAQAGIWTAMRSDTSGRLIWD
jgi:hypothetical protein